jgi:CheY-like chemotaxis protein
MAGETVLLVDDDEVFQEAVAVVLGTRYRVVTASNGTEGLARVAQERPDVIILDVMMDHLSEGFDVAGRLRTDPETSSIPIIMLTGVDQVYNLRMEVDEAWVPCDRYLEKPISPQDLLDQVDELLTAAVR